MPKEEQQQGELHPDATDQAKAADISQPPADLRQDRLDRADRELGAHNYATALTLYKKLITETKQGVPGPLHYRVALCQEALGNWDKTLQAYRQALADERFVA